MARIAVIVLILSAALPSLANDNIDPQKEECKQISSCSSCIRKSFCVWCVTKSKCTKQECGNDNIIYPNNVAAIMAGPGFCPRVVETDVSTFKSGTRNGVIVKITQIHLYMAFTPWKCKINIGEDETVVNAFILGDRVFCESIMLENKSESAYVSGSVSVIWDYVKSFDGSVPIRVCTCERAPACPPCQ